MNYFFKVLYIFLVIFLLKACGESTAPVPFTPAQTELLLTGRKGKAWKKTEVVNKKSGAVLSCSEKVTWTFFPKKDSISFSNNQSECAAYNNYSYAQYLIQTKNNVNFFKFYAYGVSEEDIAKKDTITRIITSITEKEFTTEIIVGDSTVVELFKAK